MGNKGEKQEILAYRQDFCMARDFRASDSKV
jgi:hypothetical protein